MKGTLIHTAWVLVSGCAVALVAHFFSACPDLRSQWQAIAMAVGVTTVTTALKGRSAGTALGVGAIVAAACAALKANLDPVCPGLFDSWQSHAMTGLMAGFTLWLSSPHEDKVG